MLTTSDICLTIASTCLANLAAALSRMASQSMGPGCSPLHRLWLLDLQQCDNNTTLDTLQSHHRRCLFVVFEKSHAQIEAIHVGE